MGGKLNIIKSTNILIQGFVVKVIVVEQQSLSSEGT